MQNKREIRELAAAIYARIPGKLPITDANKRGMEMLMDMAIEHAEEFYKHLDKKEETKNDG